MGCGDFGTYDDIDETRERRVVTQRQLDCKDFAREYADRHRDLRVVRGYVVLPAGFTEHWWCATKRKGFIVDVTTLAGCGGNYVPLDDDGAMVSLCDAMAGDCQQEPTCAWCKARLGLESTGLRRARLKPVNLRVVLDRLFAQNLRLQEQLARAIGDRGEDR